MFPPVVVQLTAVFALPVTVAVNCWDAPAKSDALEGEMEIEIGVMVPSRRGRGGRIMLRTGPEGAATASWVATSAEEAVGLSRGTNVCGCWRPPPPAGAAASNVTVAEMDAPAAIDAEATVTALTEVAVTGVAVLERAVPVELPLPPLPDPAGEPENVPLEGAPHPIKVATAKSTATAMPSERVRNLSLNPLAYIAGSKTPKAALLAVTCGRLPTNPATMPLSNTLAQWILPMTAPLTSRSGMMLSAQAAVGIGIFSAWPFRNS
jgi:hypothetical protein